MTTRRTHSCNLCGSYVQDGTGIGIRWGHGNAIELLTPGQAENHICQKCIDALEAALEEQRVMERKRAEADTYMPAVDAP